jgi:hypothetical protein
MTPKQQRFVEEYLIDLNATQAATRAGYSAHTANEQGARLLANASIAAAVHDALAARSERTQINADWVLEKAAELHARCVTENDRTNERQTLDLIGKHVDVQAFKERLTLDGHVTTEPLGLSDLLGEIGRAAREGDAAVH